jgi:hypothetical protein
MGNLFSSKSSENNGQISNNIVIEHKDGSTTVSVEFTIIEVCVMIITAIQIIRFTYAVYKSHKKNIIKKMQAPV